MLAIWRRISDIGIQDTTAPWLKKRMRTSNQVFASLSIISFCYIFIFYFCGFAWEALGMGGVVTVLAVPLLMSQAGQYTLARHWFIIMLNAAVTIYAFIFGRVTGIHFMFFAGACLPWVFFDLRERTYIVIGLIVPVICLLIYGFSDGEPSVAITPAVQLFIRASIVVVVSLTNALCLLFFVTQNDKAERELRTFNELLQAGKEELEVQQEELRQTNEELSQQTEELMATEEELRTQEEELRNANEELQAKTISLESARAVLADKAEELEISGKYKSEFLANMSHELRTPLNSILILANLLKQDKFGTLNEKQLEYAGIIHKSGSDLLSLINDILDLSKIEAGRMEFVFEAVTIASIVGDMQQLFGSVSADRKIQFEVSIHKDVPTTIVTDRQRLEQVLRNLLSNAFKFTAEEGRVGLAVSMSGDYIQFAVTDTGIGIPAEKLQHIFEAFRQADGTTSRKFGGTGLGLSISKELMKRLQGTLSVASTPGAGSTFTVIIPVAVAGEIMISDTSAKSNIGDYTTDGAIEQTSVSDDRNFIGKGQQSVLIIEDDLIFAAYVRDFAHERGYKTIVAVSGDEGLLYARRYRPSAIILDLGLPVIDGQSLLKILKADAELSHIPVHVVSANDRADVNIAGEQSYLRKPLQTQDLEQTFTDIGGFISSRYRSILMLAGESEPVAGMFDNIARQEGDDITYDIVPDWKSVQKELSGRRFDCLIADIGADIDAGSEQLMQLKEMTAGNIYIIACVDGNLSTSEEKKLRSGADSIIRKTAQYGGRLMDEVALFLHKVKMPETPDKGGVQVSAPVVTGDLKGKRVLLVDDDMRNVFSMTAMLEEQGMEVMAAEHGKEAIEMLEQDPAMDIVLMDIMMPEMDGYEATRRIRSMPSVRNIPVIALTAKAMTGDREKCIEAGASDYITKPVEAAKLFSLMRVWMTQK